MDEDPGQEVVPCANRGSGQAPCHLTHSRAPRSCHGPSTEQLGPRLTPSAHVHFLKLLSQALGRILTLPGARVPQEALKDPRVSQLTVQLWS